MAGPLTLRTLQYRLSATDTGFKNTMQGAQSTLRSFGETARRGITTLRNWSLAASAAGTAVALTFRKINDETAKTASKVEDLNDKTGVSRQRLQELGYAATQGSADLDILGDGLTRMTRRTAEAAAGNQAYLASYQRLGIEIRNADGTIRDTSDLFLEMAERLEQIPDVGERSRIAFNLLGDSGYALMPMLSMGRDEIERLMSEAHELSDVLSDRTVRALAMYDDTMGRFRATMRGVRNELAAASVPIFTELAQRAEAGGRAVVAWIQENREFISQVIIMVGVLTTLALGIGLVTTGFTIAGRVIGVVTSLLGFLLSPIGLVLMGVVGLYVAWNENWLGIQDLTKAAVDYIRSQWDRLMAWWEESDLGQAVRDWWAKVVAIWESDELTLPQKVVEIAKLVPGIGWVVGFVQDVHKIWSEEDLSFGEKTVAIIRLLPGGNWIVGFVADVKAVWDDEEMTFGDKVVETMRLIPGLGWLAGFIDAVKDIWANEDLTLGEKIVAIARLIPGVAWLERFVADVRAIWNDEELTFGEKAVAIARLIPGVAWLQDFVAQVKVIWADDELTLPEKAAEIARLIPGVAAVENMIGEIKEIWLRQDLTLGEKAVETFRVISDTVELEAGGLAFLLGAAITAPYILNALGDAIRTIPGILALTSGANFLRLSIAGLTLGLAIFSWQFWNADPQARENMLAEANKIIDGIFPEGIAVPAKAALRFAVEVGGAMFDAIKKGLDEGDWSDVWGAAADIWRAGATIWVSLQLATGTVMALLEAIRTALAAALGMTAAATQGLGAGTIIGILSIGVALVDAMTSGEWDQFAQDMVVALIAAAATAGLTGSVGAAGLVFTATLNLKFGSIIWDFFSQQGRQDEMSSQLDDLNARIEAALEENLRLQQEVQRRSQQAQMHGTSLAIELLERELALSSDPDERSQIEAQIAELRREFELTKSAIDEADDSLASFLVRLEEMSGQSGLAAFLAALYRAEGGSEARVPFGMTDFADAGNQFGKAENRDKFRHLLSLIDVEEGTAEFYAAAAAISVEHYWNTFLERFPELADKTLADLAPDIARMFIEHMGSGFAPESAHELNPNWVPNMISILGVRDGGESVMKAWAEGLAAGGDEARHVIDELTKWMADRMIGHSPPPEGDLKDIDDPKVGETWIQAIAREIEEEGGTLEAAIAAVAEQLKMSTSDLFKELGFEDTALGEAWAQKVAEQIKTNGGDVVEAVRQVDAMMETEWLEALEKPLPDVSETWLQKVIGLADRVWDAMLAKLEERWPQAAEFLKGLMTFEWDPADTIGEIERKVEGLIQDLDRLNNQSIQWTENLVKGISDAIAYGRDLSSVFDNFLRTIASQFLQTRVFGPLLNAWLPGVLSGLPVFHSGGLILGGASAMVMHNGGMIPGLAHDERLIIGQVGERVLSRRQNDRFEELLERQAEPQEVIHYYHINAVDAKSFADLVARNPEAITSVTIKDIGSNGPIRKAIQAVSRGG